MMKLTKKNITPVLTVELERRPEILFAYVFGSFAEAESFRDIDIGVYVRDSQPVADSLMYTIHLSLDSERKTGYPVDVVLMNTAPDHLIHSISKGIVFVDRDEEFRTEWLLRAWSRYFDYQPSRRQAVADLFE